MQISAITNILGKIGDLFGNSTAWAVKSLSELGINISVAQSKVINLVFILLAILFIIKLLGNLKTLVKWAILILLGVLALSTIISFL